MRVQFKVLTVAVLLLYSGSCFPEEVSIPAYYPKITIPAYQPSRLYKSRREDISTIGVEFSDLSPVLKDLTGARGDGVLIVKVYPGTPAEEAGLQNGDLVVRADNKKPFDMHELIDMVEAKAPDTPMSLEIKRKNHSALINVTEVKAKSIQDPEFQAYFRLRVRFGWLADQMSQAGPRNSDYKLLGREIYALITQYGETAAIRGDKLLAEKYSLLAKKFEIFRK